MNNGAPDKSALEAATVRFVPPHARNGSGQHLARGPAHERPLPLKFWSDLNTINPPDKLVRRLMGTTAMVLVVGEPGCGKTFLVTDMAIHIAMGREWFGRPVTCGAVLYVAAEGHSGLSNRTTAFKDRHGISDDVPFVVVPASVNLGPGGRDAAAIIEAVRLVEERTGKAVVLIVIDTLARSMGTGDENQAADMGQFIAACDRIRLEVGATVLVVHHRPKGSTGARGSSALPGAADTIIEVEKRDGRRVAKVTKQKDGADGIELGFDLDVIEIGHDDDGEPITSCVVAPVDSLAPAPPARKRDPSGNTGVVFRALQRALVDAGTDAPASNHLPPNARVVPPETWRRYAYEMMSESTAEARQRAFKRGYDSLLGTGHVGVWGNHAWIP